MVQSKKGKFFLIVQVDVDPEDEKEFNEWYDTEHIPMFMKVPGVLSAKRAVAMDKYPRPKYITIYEYEDESVALSEAYKKVLETPWNKKMEKKFKNFSLTFCKEIPDYWK
jgi:antibiotic biosynthesis monooxygenase (ABM) superfamily enzyme